MLTPPGFTIRYPKEGVPPTDYGAIAFMDKHWKAFAKDVEFGVRAKMVSTMKAWCKTGPTDLHEEKFKFQEHYSRGGKNTRIETFKGWQVRLYGAVMDVDGKSVFLVTGIDTTKKRTRAKDTVLENAAKKAHQLLHNT